MGEIELSPCPFCGGVGDDTHAGGDPKLVEDSHTNIFVWCPSCGAKGLVVIGGHGGTREEAITAWNRRPAIAEPKGLAKELKAAREEIKYLRRDRIMEAKAHLDELRRIEHPSHCKVWAKKPCSCGLSAEIADAEAHLRGISPPLNDTITLPIPEHGWTCFHCGETFHTVAGARRHFGFGPEQIVECLSPPAVQSTEAVRDLRGIAITAAQRYDRFERSLPKLVDLIEETLRSTLNASPPATVSVPADEGAADKVAWLIERKGFAGDPRPHWYWEDTLGHHGWTPEASAALPFATEAEAKAFPAYRMISRDPDISVTEHVFIESAAPASGGGK
jgi:hypothetical protein